MAVVLIADIDAFPGGREYVAELEKKLGIPVIVKRAGREVNLQDTDLLQQLIVQNERLQTLIELLLQERQEKRQS